MLRKIIYLLLFMLPFFLNAQEFTIKKTEAEKKREKELKDEKVYLDFQNHFFTAIQKKEKEDYEKAIIALEACKQIYPDDAGLNFEFTKNYYHLKDYDNAIYFANKVLDVKPKNSYVLEYLKKIYRTQRDYDAAIKIQQRIITINPKKKQDLIPLYFANNQIDKAKSLFIELQNNHESINNESYYKRVFFPKQNKVKTKITNDVSEIKSDSKNKSISQLQATFKKNKDYKTLKKLLLEEEKQLKYNLIAKDSKNGLSYFPAQPFLYYAQGKAQNKLAQYNEAIEVLKAGLDYIIDDNKLEASFYTELYKVYLALGKTKEATKFQEKANKLK